MGARDDSEADKADPWGCHILTFDGGGVQAFGTLLMIRALMKIIETVELNSEVKNSSSADSPHLSESPHPGEFLPCHYFDIIGGTSTGGLISIMLGRLRMSADQVIDNLFDVLKPIRPSSSLSRTFPFRRRVSWSTKILDQALKVDWERKTPKGSPIASPKQSQTSVMPTEEAATKFVLDSKSCKTIVLSFNVKDGFGSPYLFRSYQHSLGRQTSQDIQDLNIDDVLRASLATPGECYRLRHLGKFFDGSNACPNPTLEIYREVSLMALSEHHTINFVLSLGTAVEGRRKKASSTLLSRISTMSAPSAQFTELLADRRVDTEMLEIRKKKGIAYFRFDITSGSDCSFEDDSAENGRELFDKIKLATSRYIESQEVQDNLRLCARALVKRRRRRASTKAWLSFIHRDLPSDFRASPRDSYKQRSSESLDNPSVPGNAGNDGKGNHYRCMLDGCNLSIDDRFDSRDDFLLHLIIDHQLPPPDASHSKAINDILDRGLEAPVFM